MSAESRLHTHWPCPPAHTQAVSACMAESGGHGAHAGRGSLGRRRLLTDSAIPAWAAVWPDSALHTLGEDRGGGDGCRRSLSPCDTVRRRAGRDGPQRASRTAARGVWFRRVELVRVGRDGHAWPGGQARGPEWAGLPSQPVSCGAALGLDPAARRHAGAVTARCHGAVTARCHGAVTAPCHGAVTARCHGAVTARCHGAVTAPCS
jgi:hypothetical protein